MATDKRYSLSVRAVRQLAADHERLRGTPVRPVVPQFSPDPFQAEKFVTIGLAQEEISPATTAPAPQFDSGSVRIHYIKHDGSVGESLEYVTAFNLLARGIAIGDVVFLSRDPWSMRWMITGTIAADLANVVYFKATEDFTVAAADFSAELLHTFHGADPRPTQWPSSGDGTIYNPPVNGGASYFFSGTNGDHGFALWHDDDAITPGAPAGYWVFQLRCQA